MRYNNDDDSFDKDIPDADSKKVREYHFKLKKDMHGKHMSYVCVENVRKRRHSTS